MVWHYNYFPDITAHITWTQTQTKHNKYTDKQVMTCNNNLSLSYKMCKAKQVKTTNIK